MTKEESFKQFCDEIAKEAPQYAEMMRDNCFIVGSFNRAWEESHKNTIDNACELYETEVNQFKNMLNFFKKGAGDLILIQQSISLFRQKLKDKE